MRKVFESDHDIVINIDQIISSSIFAREPGGGISDHLGQLLTIFDENWDLLLHTTDIHGRHRNLMTHLCHDGK